MKSFWNNLTRSALVRNTAWMLGGRGARLVLQAVYFVLIARALGPGQYGAFIGAVSLITIASPFSAWGTGFLLVEQVARDRNAFPRSWGNAVSITSLSGSMLIVVVLLAAGVFFGGSVPITVVLLVGVADLLFVRVLDLAAQAFQAIEVLQKTAELYLILGFARTVAAIVFAFAVPKTTATSWAALYCISAGIAALYALISILRSPLGLPGPRLSLSFSEFRQGFYYAIGLASQTAYNDIDKAILVRLAGLEVTGVYGSAYRIVDVAFAPIGALTGAAYARFFRHGRNGMNECMLFAKKLLRYGGLYGVLTVVALFFGAPVLPVLLGQKFAAASTVLVWLSPIVLIRTIHNFFSNVLTGAGHQGLRSCIQIASAFLNLTLNLWLIPRYSWRGAAWSSLVTDGLLAITFSVVAHVLAAKEVATSPQPELVAQTGTRGD